MAHVQLRGGDRETERAIASSGSRPALRSSPGARPATPPYLTVFLIDGLSGVVFERERRAGRLPELSRLMAEGTYVERGIAAFPSLTGYGYFPLLTARDAARSGVLGLRWFDRARREGNFRHYVGRTHGRMNEDFDARIPWLFEQFSSEHSYSLNSCANRGVGRDDSTSWAFAMARYREHSMVLRTLARLPVLGRFVPDWKQAETRGVERAVRDLVRVPKIQWISFTSPDAHQHLAGTDAAYVEGIRHIDRLIGRYRAECARLGLERDRLYLVASDHGVADAVRNIDLRVAFRRAGLRAWRGDATHLRRTTLAQPLAALANEDAIIAVNGNMLNHIYLRYPNRTGPSAWQTPPPPEVVDRYAPDPTRDAVNLPAVLRREEGVELVLTRAGKDGVRVFGREGVGFIRAAAPGALSYRVEGGDPLRTDCADGQARSEREWLERTSGAPFPDGVVRAYRLMTAPGAGELAVTAQEGYDLGAHYELFVGNCRGGHGGLRADQMLVPYILAGPGVPSGRRVLTARAEDIGATLFSLLGVPLPPEAEGAPLAGLNVAAPRVLRA